jgi:hypothetical protein
VSGPDARSLATRFAARLDADDFAGLEPMLAAGCAYETGRGTLTGPQAILGSYREASERARRLFDAVRYDSEVIEAGDGFAVIQFRDHLEVRGRTHVYRCRQRVTFGGDGTVTRIEHGELPGEREQLTAFCRDAGVELGA